MDAIDNDDDDDTDVTDDDALLITRDKMNY